MKIVFGFIGALIAMAVIFVFVGLLSSYLLIFINFAGPESVVGPCFEIGFSFGLICALIAGYLICRPFWREYMSGKPD
jgi:hypothetical protein